MPREASAAGIKRQRGFSLFELVVVIAIIALLLAVAIDRLWALQADAEQVAMEQVLGSLRSALGMNVALCLVNDDSAGIAALAGSNPMDRLERTPKNYLGAVSGTDPAHIPGGTWYFDLRSKTLVYRVRNADRFRGGLGGEPARAAFTIQLVYGVRSPGEARRPIVGADLVAVAPYRWKQGRMSGL
ncbi:MAG: prepilin-type N-terminal cleavage/methylation domain-containing protein [Acidiferrobacterales bacterium]